MNHMPVDNTSFRSDLVQTRLPLLGEPVLTPATLEQLKIPDEVALRPENVIPFLAGQAVKYNEIVNRPEIKSLAGDIPEFRFDDAPQLQVATAMSREEQAAMQSWSHEVMVGIQSDPDLDKLEQEIDDYVKKVNEAHPELAAEASSSSDGIDDFLFMQGIQETIEEKKEWERKLRLAASSGSAEILNSIMGERAASGYMKLIGKSVEGMAKKDAEYQKAIKDLLPAGNGNISQADSLRASSKMSEYQGDRSSIMMSLNYAMGEYQRITQETSKTNADIGKPQQVMIQNMKA